MTGIDRAALIDAAAEAMQPHRNPVAEPELARRIRDDAARVVDAVLPLIADDLSRYVEANRALPTQSDYIVGQVSGLELAEQVIRSLSQDGGNPDA